MFSWFKITHRLVLSGSLLVVLIATCIFFFSQTVDQTINFTKQESAGNALLKPYTSLLHNVSIHQLEKLRTIYGSSNSHAQNEIETSISNSLQEITATPNEILISLKLDDEALQQADKKNISAKALNEKWQALTQEKTYNRELYKALLTDIKDSITYIGNSSNLILAPDLDSYYLMDAVAVSLPQNIFRQADLAAIFIQLSKETEISRQDSMRAALFSGMLQESDMQHTSDDLNTAFKEDKNFHGESDSLKKLQEPLNNYISSQDYLVKITSEIANKGHVNGDYLIKSLLNSHADTYALWEQSNIELEKLLQKRIEFFVAKKQNVFLINILGLAVATCFYFLVIHSITKPLRIIRERMSELADNKTDFITPFTEQKNEIGSMSRALASLKTSVESNLLMQEMTSDYPVIKCSKDLTIEFMNAASVDLLAKLNFRNTSLLKANLNTIHNEFSKYRTHFNSSQKEPAVERLNLQSRWIEFRITPLLQNNKYNGLYLNLIDVTESVENEKAVAFAQENIQRIIDCAYQGQLSERLNPDLFWGFYKNLASSINGLMDTILEPINTLIIVLSKMSQGNLSDRIQGNFSGTFKEMQQSVNSTLDTFSSIVERITNSSDTVASASAEITAGVSDLAKRTELQAASVEETASSMDSISSAAKRNASDSETAKEFSDTAMNIAVSGGEKVRETINSIQLIEQSSKQIAHIIDVIDEIAFQTNLLALNAAVEAARAGEAGKGFAVVAQEVRALAARSADSSKEIKNLIKTSVSNVQNGVKIAKVSGEAIEKMLESIHALADVVSNITNSSKEQCTRINEVGLAVSDMDQALQQNAALVEETNAAAESLRQQAHDLRQMVGFFHLS